MKKTFGILIAVFFLIGALAPPAMAVEALAAFNGGIGVIPVSRVAGMDDPSGVYMGLPVPNIVRGVSPGGQPWMIESLVAVVDFDGRINVAGQGLLLAGGNGIGTTGMQKVYATLFCGFASDFTAHSSGTVALEPNGDFMIDDMLLPMPPHHCPYPVLLIVNTGGYWLAAGIPE